jgi:hypothetical protein
MDFVRFVIRAVVCVVGFGLVVLLVFLIHKWLH